MDQGRLKIQKIHYKINRRPSQSKNNSARSKAQIKRREREKSSVRAKVEHVLAIVKGRFQYRKTRYRGLLKQTAKLNMVFALANLILADRPCLSAWFSLRTGSSIPLLLLLASFGLFLWWIVRCCFYVYQANYTISNYALQGVANKFPYQNCRISKQHRRNLIMSMQKEQQFAAPSFFVSFTYCRKGTWHEFIWGSQGRHTDKGGGGTLRDWGQAQRHGLLSVPRWPNAQHESG